MTHPDVLKRPKQLSIVLVEDDAEIGNWIKEKLKQLDRITSFKWIASISETLETLQNQIPDVIILDLNLPDGNGIEILQIIRKEKIRAKVIVFSINTGMRNVCLRMGAHAFYDKGSGSEEMINELETGNF